MGARDSNDAARAAANKTSFSLYLQSLTGWRVPWASNSDLHRRRGAAIARGVSNSLSVYAQKARNAEIWDVEGRRYIDFASGIAVLNTGHAASAGDSRPAAAADAVHPCLLPGDALRELCRACASGSTRWRPADAEEVDPVFHRRRGHRERAQDCPLPHAAALAVIAFHGAFHGRTLATMTLTGKVAALQGRLRRAAAGCVPRAVSAAPTTASRRSSRWPRSSSCSRSDIEAARVAAILIEPVQGEGGFYVAPPEFLRSLRTPVRPRTASSSLRTRSSPGLRAPAACSPSNMPAWSPT